MFIMYPSKPFFMHKIDSLNLCAFNKIELVLNVLLCDSWENVPPVNNVSQIHLVPGPPRSMSLSWGKLHGARWWLLCCCQCDYFSRFFSGHEHLCTLTHTCPFVLGLPSDFLSHFDGLSQSLPCPHLLRVSKHPNPFTIFHTLSIFSVISGKSHLQLPILIYPLDIYATNFQIRPPLPDPNLSSFRSTVPTIYPLADRLTPQLPQQPITCLGLQVSPLFISLPGWFS